MTLKIIHKNNTSAGQAPAPSDLDIGEIAVNSADAELYTKDTNGNIKKFANTDTTSIASGVQFTQAGTGAVERTVESKLQDVVSVKDFGAVGDGVADDTAKVGAAVAYINAVGGILYFPAGQYLIDAGTINISRDGVTLVGAGSGNNANVFPATTAPTSIIIRGAGAGIRVRSQSVTLKGFRLTADTAREATAFVITSPGIRIEPDDTATARADRCSISGVRVDKQPGDGILTVGSCIYADFKGVDIYECKGFGFRLEPGSYAGLVRTNPHYPGLSKIESCRVGYCGGHTVAASNDGVIVQAQMAIRYRFVDIDSFGNGQNTSIMYPSADGKFYDFWIFGENCEVVNSGPCGRVGLSLTPELLGGLWIAGRDHIVENNRFIDTSQPIYWGYKSAQPSTGLTVNTFRIVNSTLTHAECVKVESPLAKGLRVYYDRKEFFTDVATRRIGADFIDSEIHFQGTVQHLSGITNTGETISLNDDAVYAIPISGLSASVSAQGVLVITCSSVASGGGIFHVRLSPTTPIATKWAGETNTVAFAGGGALSGTTGTDGTLNISCDNTTIYIENRRGFLVAFTYQIASFNRGYNIGI